MIDRNSVMIEPGLIDRLATHLAPSSSRGRLFIVADETAWHFHGERVLAGLGGADVVTIQSGEDSKSWPQLIALIDQLLAKDIARSDTILAFGGGVVGDLSGFAAAIIKRGCRFVQIPTSLLAQVDSAVGGKTAINVAAGKNLVGAFHQPEQVLIDPELLATLDVRHMRAGYAEIVKYALIDDPEFFAWLEEQGKAVLALVSEPLLHAIRSSIAAKLRLVDEDERDTKGQRALLNFGHTFAHALEAETGFSERLLHGEAVAIGIVHAFRFSEERGLCSAEDADRVERHLRGAGLPLRSDCDPARLIAHMRQDKKRDGGKSTFVLTRGIGRAFLDRDVPLAEVETYLRESLSVAADPC